MNYNIQSKKKIKVGNLYGGAGQDPRAVLEDILRQNAILEREIQSQENILAMTVAAAVPPPAPAAPVAVALPALAAAPPPPAPTAAVAAVAVAAPAVAVAAPSPAAVAAAPAPAPVSAVAVAAPAPAPALTLAAAAAVRRLAAAKKTKDAIARAELVTSQAQKASIAALKVATDVETGLKLKIIGKLGVIRKNLKDNIRNFTIMKEEYIRKGDHSSEEEMDDIIRDFTELELFIKKNDNLSEINRKQEEILEKIQINIKKRAARRWKKANLKVKSIRGFVKAGEEHKSNKSNKAATKLQSVSRMRSTKKTFMRMTGKLTCDKCESNPSILTCTGADKHEICMKCIIDYITGNPSSIIRTVGKGIGLTMSLLISAVKKNNQVRKVDLDKSRSIFASSEFTVMCPIKGCKGSIPTAILLSKVPLNIRLILLSKMQTIKTDAERVRSIPIARDTRVLEMARSKLAEKYDPVRKEIKDRIKHIRENLLDVRCGGWDREGNPRWPEHGCGVFVHPLQPIEEGECMSIYCRHCRERGVGRAFCRFCGFSELNTTPGSVYYGKLDAHGHIQGPLRGTKAYADGGRPAHPAQLSDIPFAQGNYGEGDRAQSRRPADEAMLFDDRRPPGEDFSKRFQFEIDRCMCQRVIDYLKKIEREDIKRAVCVAIKQVLIEERKVHPDAVRDWFGPFC